MRSGFTCPPLLCCVAYLSEIFGFILSLISGFMSLLSLESPSVLWASSTILRVHMCSGLRALLGLDALVLQAGRQASWLVGTWCHPIQVCPFWNKHLCTNWDETWESNNAVEWPFSCGQSCCCFQMMGFTACSWVKWHWVGRTVTDLAQMHISRLKRTNSPKWKCGLFQRKVLWKIHKIHRGMCREGKILSGSLTYAWDQRSLLSTGLKPWMRFCFFYCGYLDGVGNLLLIKTQGFHLPCMFYKALACFLIWKIRCYVGFPVSGAVLTKTPSQIIPQRCCIPCMSVDFEMFILMECKYECAFKKCCCLNLCLQQKKIHYKCHKWMMSGFCIQVSHKLSLLTQLASKYT